MRRFAIKAGVLAAALAISAVPAHAQSRSRTRVGEITELFNKKKHSKKTRNGVTVEKYREIRSEPLILPNFAGYAGSYWVDGSEMTLDLAVAADGSVTGSGTEQFPERPDVRRTFRLRNGRIEGALLTATKVYGNGSTDQIEGVFMKMTSFESPTDSGTSQIGIGMAGRFYLEGNVSVDRIFFQRRD